METTEREEDKDLATKPKKEEEKFCPILSSRALWCMCQKEKCALWVKGHKDTIHPDYYLVYDGCGLISEIFWEKRSRNHVRTPKTP